MATNKSIPIRLKLLFKSIFSKAEFIQVKGKNTEIFGTISGIKPFDTNSPRI